MAYLALYRAFRPETLDEVVRQEHIVTILRNQILNDRVGHAYLFCGPRGTGKTSIAKIFARAVNCQHPVNGSPCGACPACKALSKGNSLDIVEIDAASNNGVDEMRDLREKVQYPPVNGRYKVYIVDEVHMLSSGAFNALLKTLEEPPAHAVFILATTEAQKIPATILSRCMRFDFKLIPQEDLENHLKRILDKLGKPYEEEAVAAIARAGAGSVRDMLSIADICVSYERGTLTYAAVNAVLGSADFAMISALCAAMLQGDMPTALSLTERVLSEGKGIGILVRDILQFLNNCAIAKMCRNAEEILCLPGEMYQKIKETAEKTDGHRLLRASEIFADTESKLRYSTSARVVLETAVMKASMPETDYNIDALSARVSALEEAVRSGVTAVPAPALEPPPRAEKSNRPAVGQTAEEDDFPPLPEEPVFDVGYDMAPPPVTRESFKNRQPMPWITPKNDAKNEKEETIVPARTNEVTETPPAAPQKEEKTAAPSSEGVPMPDKSKAFGMFLRSLRKTSRNGVLFTMCSELDSVFEGDKMVFYTTSETICNALQRPEHRATMSQALSSIGVLSYEVRLRGKKGDDFTEKLNWLKADFPDTDIRVR